MFEKEVPKTRKQVLDTLRELDRALVFRMSVDEEIPRHLRITRVGEFCFFGIFFCLAVRRDGEGYDF
jgi:hypothetical protein